VNAQGGVLGRPIEFVIYDDGSDEKAAVRLYEKLIAEDKVDAVLGTALPSPTPSPMSPRNTEP
jgi:branched-chain amino acid transport system substrate-binding protein